MDFIIGTTNKAKLRACEEVLNEYYPNSKSLAEVLVQTFQISHSEMKKRELVH